MRLTIRWVLLGVGATSILAPVLALVVLPGFSTILVRTTERELNAQGALVAAQYQATWASLRGQRPGNPRTRGETDQRFTPLYSRLHNPAVRCAGTQELPSRTPLSGAEADAYASLSRTLKSAQVFNLSGVRVLDTDGCAVASSREAGRCYRELPEVTQALAGRSLSVLRRGISDEPTPALRYVSRSGYVRVFVALPVWNDGQVIGAVLLSRTSESGLEWLNKQRKDVFFGTLTLVSLTVLASFLFARLFTRPLAVMKRRLEEGETGDLAIGAVAAPPELQTLGVALDQHATELAAKDRYIKDFAANVSHELKTPLTSIRDAVELLQAQATTMAPEKQQRFLRNIDAAASRTDRLITRLLHLARLESGQEVNDERVVVHA